MEKSFSQTVKEEISHPHFQSVCCRRAFFTAMLLYGASVGSSEIRFVTENHDVIDTFAEQCSAFDLSLTVTEKQGKTTRYYGICSEKEKFSRCLTALGIKTKDGIRYRIPQTVMQNPCCRRAFLKGAFFSGGTVVNPKKNYLLELTTPYMGLSRETKELLEDEGFSFKSTVRRSNYVVYLKNSEQISDFLSYIEAYQAQMEFLNNKIEKEIYNNFNRTSNGEVANYEKTVAAAVTQIRAISKIRDTVGLDSLPEDLQALAILRLEHKNASLTELAKLSNPPLTKSGVDRRMKKLITLAEET